MRLWVIHDYGCQCIRLPWDWYFRFTRCQLMVKGNIAFAALLMPSLLWCEWSGFSCDLWPLDVIRLSFWYGYDHKVIDLFLGWLRRKIPLLYLTRVQQIPQFIIRKFADGAEFRGEFLYLTCLLTYVYTSLMYKWFFYNLSSLFSFYWTCASCDYRGCDKCEEWFHGKCIKITPERAAHIKRYFCDACRTKDPELRIRYKKRKDKDKKKDREKRSKDDEGPKPKKVRRYSTILRCGDVSLRV